MSLSASAADAIVLLIESAPIPDVSTALKTISTLVKNAADPAKAVLKTTNAGLQKRVLGFNGGDATLIALGFVADPTAGTLTWDASNDSVERAALVAEAQVVVDAIAIALTALGDSNAPGQAREALKLCSTYVANIVSVGEPEATTRRRIGAANKALNGRLLSAKGGLALLISCGFAAEPAQGEPEAYVCGLDAALLRVAFATLEKAPSIWASLAAERADSNGAEAGSGGGGGPKVSSDEKSVALDNIIIRTLPSRAEVEGRSETRDMQPALCKSDNGIHALLLTYQCATKTWTEQGRMEIPGGDFEWACVDVNKGPCLLIEVDLGDAHGTGKASIMRVPFEANGAVNEYTASRDFINEHEAESYEQHKEPVLNMNWLEEIARKVREASDPVLQTVSRLKTAMIEQH